MPTTFSHVGARLLAQPYVELLSDWEAQGNLPLGTDDGEFVLRLRLPAIEGSASADACAAQASTVSDRLRSLTGVTVVASEGKVDAGGCRLNLRYQANDVLWFQALEDPTATSDHWWYGGQAVCEADLALQAQTFTEQTGVALLLPPYCIGVSASSGNFFVPVVFGFAATEPKTRVSWASWRTRQELDDALDSLKKNGCIVAKTPPANISIFPVRITYYEKWVGPPHYTCL
jgi:hypothetical protein